MNAARTRIGRVTMKAGGAEVRIIERAKDTSCTQKIRDWSRNVLGSEAGPPHAFFAIAFWQTEYAGSADSTVAWESDHVAFPIDMLPHRAMVLLTRMLAVNAAENRVMRELGYRNDEPDPAS